MPRRKITDGQQSVIYKADEEKLYLFVYGSVAPDENDSADLAEKKKKRAERLKAFHENHARNSSVTGVGEKLRRLTYESIPEFIKAAGISYRDLVEITNGENGERAPLNWASKTEKSMCYVCDSLPPEKRAVVYRLVLDALPEPLHAILRSNNTSGNRVFDAAEARTNAYDEIWSVIKEDVMLRNIYTYRGDLSKSSTVVPFSRYNYVVQAMDVSYHWLLNLDEKTCILAKHGDTEMIMDAFCLLPEQWKQRLLAGVKLYADTRKEA